MHSVSLAKDSPRPPTLTKPRLSADSDSHSSHIEHGHTRSMYYQDNLVMDLGSPLFGVTGLGAPPHSEFLPLPPLDLDGLRAQEKQYGEFSVSDIAIDPLPPLLPRFLDDPLPLSSPFLSSAVLLPRVGLGHAETDKPSLVVVDFDLFGRVESASMPSSHFTPLEPARLSRPHSQSHPYFQSHPHSLFDHVQSRAISFDRSLESPLGESPLVFAGAQSVSPEFSGGCWSPNVTELNAPGSTSISPLLVDNLGPGPNPQPSGSGGGHQVANLFAVHDVPTLGGLVSSYLEQNTALYPSRQIDLESRPRIAFSPVMSQKTFENLQVDCPVDDLPSLPPLPTRNKVTDTVVNEEDEDDAEEEQSRGKSDDADWNPEHDLASRAPAQTRSTRRRPEQQRPSLVDRHPPPPPHRRSTFASSKSHSSHAVVLAPDAPIQPRTYHTESRTSLKPIPQAILRRHARSIDRGEVVTQGQLEDEAARRRRMNTLSARESRRRKAEAIEGQAKENEQLKTENGRLRLRVGELELENGTLRDRVGELVVRLAVGGGSGEEEGCAKRARCGV